MTLHTFIDYGRIGAIVAVLTASLSAATLSDLSKKADLVVVGTVNTRTETAQRVAFNIAVERVLKGDGSLRIIPVSHDWNRKGVFISNTDTIAVQLHGLWFLRATASGNWDVLPASGPDGVLPSLFFHAAQALPAAYRNTPSASLVDTLTRELAAGVELARGSPEVLLHSLQSLDGPVIRDVLAQFTASPAVSTQAVGLAGLLERGTQDAVTQLGRLWPAIDKDASRSQVLSALRDSFRDQTPASVKQLAQLAEAAPSADLRVAAIHSLASIHTKEALPFLAGLLLSSDADEQMKGVFGLSAFVNGCPAQNPGNVASMEYLQFKSSTPYRTKETMAAFAFRRGPADQESRLVSFWLNWWSANRAALGH